MDGSDAAARHGLLCSVLEQIGYGVILVGGHSRLLHANDAGRAACSDDERAVFDFATSGLVARFAEDREPLRRALARAGGGLRTLLRMGVVGAETFVAVVPMGDDAAGDHEVLLMLSRQSPCEQLTIALFSQGLGLTDAEQRVLGLVCRGRRPAEIARELGVGLATVRTQLSTIRAKAGANSVSELVQRVATLPPITSLIGQGGRVRGTERPAA